MTTTHDYLKKISSCIKQNILDADEAINQLNKRLKIVEYIEDDLLNNTSLTYKTLYKHLINTNYNTIDEFIQYYTNIYLKKFFIYIKLLFNLYNFSLILRIRGDYRTNIITICLIT